MTTRCIIGCFSVISLAKSMLVYDFQYDDNYERIIARNMTAVQDATN